METRVGISGWIYPEWKNTLYPERLPQSRELEFASRQVNSIEINGTFYSLQSPERFQKWYGQTPDDFVFSVKGSRYLTHIRRLVDAEQPLSLFFGSGVLLLKEKLGPILWQLPPSLKLDMTIMRSFVDLLPRDFKSAALLGGMSEFTGENRSLRYAIEPRHESFRDPMFADLLREAGVALVYSDGAGEWPTFEELTADFAYVRLHGASRLYADGYSDAAINQWVHKIEAWRRKGIEDVYFYFDNTGKVRAPFDAVVLQRRLTGGEPQVPMRRYPPKSKSSKRKIAERQAA